MKTSMAKGGNSELRREMRSVKAVTDRPQPDAIGWGMNGNSIQFDVAIAGAGTAGLALAVALKQGLGNGFAVAVCDPALAREPAADDRVSAIAGGARRLLTALGAWQRLAEPVQPILSMEITDSRLADAVRPTFLSFDGDGEPAAHMVENRDTLNALRAAAREAGVQFIAAAVEQYEADDSGVRLRLTDGAELQARLLVAADGARSKLREQAGIK